MTKMKRLLAAAGTLPTLLLLLILCLGRVLASRRALGRARFIVVARHAGFGHTVVGPDVTRRVFREGRPVFVYFSDSQFHNPRLPQLWSEPVVISLPLRLQAGFGRRSLALSCPEWGKAAVRRWTLGLAGRLIPPGATVHDLLDLYANLPLPAVEKAAPVPPANYLWPIAYFKLQREVPASPLRLPPVIAGAIRARLRAAAGEERPKLCALYLRRKGVGGDDLANVRRSGSGLESYLPAVRALNEAGFQVLLSGDVLLPADIHGAFGGGLVDAAALACDREWVALFAGTEADIFIGEPGGGVWLPGINGIPRLLVNAFPYFFGLPGSWLYYKAVYDESGRRVPYAQLFREHAYDYELAGMRLEANGPDEILEAVSSFLGDLRERPDHDPHADVIATLPELCWARQGGARLSSAWLRRF